MALAPASPIQGDNMDVSRIPLTPKWGLQVSFCPQNRGPSWSLYPQMGTLGLSLAPQNRSYMSLWS